MPVIRIVFVVLALLCFLVGTVRAINVQPPGNREINWMSAGLALLVIAYFVGGA